MISLIKLEPSTAFVGYYLFDIMVASSNNFQWSDYEKLPLVCKYGANGMRRRRSKQPYYVRKHRKQLLVEMMRNLVIKN